MATCGCSKEVFRQSYELLYQDLSLRYKNQGWSDREIRREAARQFRPRYQLDVASYIRESTEKGAYYTAEFTIDLHGRIFFPSYNISLEALHDNQRRKTPDQYSLSDHQTSRMIEEAFRRGATTVVTSYARDGNDNRDIVVMIYDPKTKMGKQMIINAAPEGSFHSFEGIQAIAERQFGHLNKVSPSDRVFILTDRAISLPQAQSVIQQVVQETKANQRSYASSNESFADGHKLRRDANGSSNELKKARQDPKESFSTSQAEEKNWQDREGPFLFRGEMQSEINERSYASKIVSDNKEKQGGTNENDDQRRVDVNGSYESRRYEKFSTKVQATPSITIEKKDRRVIEVPIGIADQKGIRRRVSSIFEVSISILDQKTDSLLKKIQQNTFQGEFFNTINDKQGDNYAESDNQGENGVQNKETNDPSLERISEPDRFMLTPEGEALPIEYTVIDANSREKVGKEESDLGEIMVVFQESEGELQKQAIMIIDETDRERSRVIESQRNQEMLPSAIEEEVMVLWFVYQAFTHGIGDRVLPDDQQEFVLSQEQPFIDEVATEEQDFDMIGDQQDALIEEFFAWIHEQPSVVAEFLYEYEGSEDDENKKADKRINIPVALFFLVALQRIANRSIDPSFFDSKSHDLDFSRKVFHEKSQVKAVDLAKHLDVRNENENPQMSFFDRQEENFILWWNANSEEEFILRIFSFHVLCMFLNANRAFPDREQVEEYRYSLWILLSIIRYMTMMKENAMSSYHGLQHYAYSSKKLYNFPQSGVIFMLSLGYDGYTT